MQINVLSLTIKTLSFVKAKQAIERLGENSKIQKQHINTRRLAIHFSISNYQTRVTLSKLVRDRLRMQ